jgi:hypothetical protein
VSPYGQARGLINKRRRGPTEPFGELHQSSTAKVEGKSAIRNPKSAICKWRGVQRNPSGSSANQARPKSWANPQSAIQNPQYVNGGASNGPLRGAPASPFGQAHADKSALSDISKWAYVFRVEMIVIQNKPGGGFDVLRPGPESFRQRLDVDIPAQSSSWSWGRSGS